MEKMLPYVQWNQLGECAGYELSYNVDLIFIGYKAKHQKILTSLGKHCIGILEMLVCLLACLFQF